MSSQKEYAHAYEPIPAPATAHVEERPSRRRRVFRRLTVAIVAALAIYQATQLLDLDLQDYVPPCGKHASLSKPLSAEAARKLFLTVPDPQSALAASRLYATHPHIAGGAEDLSDAKTILSLYQSAFSIPRPSEEPIFAAGSADSQAATLGASNLTEPQAWIDIYYPVLNTPLDRSVQILDQDGSVVFDANLVEDGDERDPEAGRYRDAVPTFHGLSRDGDVTGEIVYANYGTFDDYAELEKKGVDMKGKIALVRYGAIFRGLKIKRAQELGAAGVLIYSDPRDDGHVTVENGYEPYPAGPARNPTSVQRGSVQYLSAYPGDPTTPGLPAYENSTRTEGTNIPTIPSLPISWENAQHLLKELGGDSARTLDGKVSERKIRLVNHVDTKVTPIWNTYAAIPGHIRDEVVVVGCHRDAWVMGAADPTSGTVSVREIVRGFGHLLRSGWKPLRTVIFVSWDAEEYGLVGSTEWGEDFPEWIQKHVVSYLNVDVSVAGSRWRAAASPSLAHLIRANALQVPHPTIANKTLWDSQNDEGPFGAGDMDAEALQAHALMTNDAVKKEDKGHMIVSPLGSGSDYTVFLQRLGVASSDGGFGGSPSDAVYHYHSIYDSQHWQERYADPGFERHVAVAKHLGLMALSLTDAIILPLNTTHYAVELHDYLDRVEKLADEASLDKSPDFSVLRKAIEKLQHSSSHFDNEKTKAEKHFLRLLKKLEGLGFTSEAEAWAVVSAEEAANGNAMLEEDDEHDEHHDEHSKHYGLVRHGKPSKELIKRFIRAAMRVRRVNQKLIAFERGFIDEAGIKDREWYRHLGVAPGKWLGYGATTLPALTEAITYERDSKLAEKEGERLAGRVTKMAKALKA